MTNTPSQTKLADPWLKSEIISTAKLFGPIFLGQISTTATGVVDTVMAGAAGSVHLAGVSIGASFFWPTCLFVIGLALIIQPTVAQLRGAQDYERIAPEVYLSSVVVLATSVILSIATCFLPYAFTLLPSVNQEMIHIGKWYLYTTAAGIPGFALFAIMRNYWEGLGITLPSSFFGFFALIINIPLNYIFIFGKFGAPELGGIGCGVATTLTVYLTVIFMYFYVRYSPSFAHCRLFVSTYSITFQQVKKYLCLSIPLAFSTTIEMACFSLVAFFLAPFGHITIASHTVAMNVSGVIYMIPLSLASAVAIRVGASLGANNWKGADRAAKAAFVLGLIFYISYFSLLFFFKENIVAMYSNEEEVKLLGATLLIFCLVYLLPENIMTVASGVVRGFKDTKTIFFITLVIYWVIGLPVGLVLCYGWVTSEPMSAQGFWIGFICALSSGCVLYCARIIYLFKRHYIPKTFTAN